MSPQLSPSSRLATAVLVAWLSGAKTDREALLADVNAASRYLEHLDPMLAVGVAAEDETDQLILGLAALVVRYGEEVCGSVEALVEDLQRLQRTDPG